MSFCRLPSFPGTCCTLQVLLLAVLAFAAPAAARERYLVTLASGERLETDELPAWPTPEKPAEVAGRNLFDPENPVALVRDQKAESVLSSPALRMANGDLLNAVPQRLAPESGRSGEPTWLEVKLEAGLAPVEGSTLLIRADRVRRILASGQPLFPEPPPGTVVLVDGRQLTARSIRWREYGLALLTESGIVETSFAEIADAVLPGADLIQGVVEDNLWAGHEGQAILRYSLTGGGSLTTSQATRVEEKARSRGRRIEVFYHVQPAWSRAAIALPEEAIAWCGYRAPHEALLPLLPAETLASRRLVGQPHAWRSVGGPSETVPTGGGRESDLAVATHAHSEIAFELPRAAKSLSLAVGIAQQVRPGGCVVCKVFAEEPGGELLWESGFLTGADPVKETGELEVAGFRRVVLVTEFGHDGRPSGADPLDIRDEVRWLRPIVRLDRAQLKSPTLLAPLLPGLETWQAQHDQLADDAPTDGAGAPGAKRSAAPASDQPIPTSAASPWSQVAFETLWSDVHDRWEPVLVIPRGQALSFTREVSIDRSCDILELAAACPSGGNQHDFAVSVNGQPLTPTLSREPRELRKMLENILPRLRRRERQSERERSFDDTLACWWDLQAFRGQSVTLTLTLRAVDGDSRIAWRGLALRSAIGNLPEDGRLPTVDVGLDTLDPHDLSSHKDRGSPAKNALPGRRGEPIRYLGQPATGGYGMVRNSHVTFDLKPEYRRFVAVVGAVGAASGPFEVLVDDQIVWHKKAVDNLAPAELLQIDLPAGARQLTIVNGNEGSYSGHAGWTDAGFLTK